MKKIIFVSLLSLFIFFGCDSIPSEVVDVSEVEYNLTAITAPEQFNYTDLDSTFSVSLSFSNASTISSVWFNILTSDGTTAVKQNVQMNESMNDGEVKMFSGSTVLGQGIPTGQYVLEFYVEDNVTAGNQKIRKVAAQKFEFINGEDNSAPVISNLAAPDTIIVQDPKSLIELHLKVDDSNGLLDVKEVYFNVFGPGSTTGNKVNMFDDGVVRNGDSAAGDGVYSIIIEITPTNTKGDYRFEFEAVDRIGEVSNKIIHILTVK